MTVEFDLDGQTAVVTGGAGLIGRALSRGLADYGANVVVADVERSTGGDLARRIGDHATYIQTDITDGEAVENLIETVINEFGSIDILVNAAYPRNENYGQPYEEITLADWRENVDLHLNSYFYTAYCASLAMKDQDSGGSIINVGSIYGVQAPDFNVYDNTPITSPVEYAAIKGGILNLTRYMASYLGEHNIRVNAVSPGGIRNEQESTFIEQYEARTPLGRLGDPADLIGAVVYLASDAASYVTGHNLVVDGGWTAK
ncbi:oxidoreductase [Natrinema ejinorense]|uniref:Short-chain dehydrogenase n=1 Tax=Natrinema ejinorense TaxID=373386 RepID=A0A2A5QQC7_9EURY|nr:oxidoreductase [Natrinema ejinorense]PCR89012.1 short-chain dehydrogenase [Natrinema ejinorense]